MLMSAEHSQLLLVDYQARLMPAIDGRSAVVANAVRLARLAATLGIPVWGTEQSPDKLGPNLAPIREACGRTLAKTHFNAVDDGLADWLRPGVADGLGQLVLAGCEAQVCLLQTGLGLLGAGFAVWVVSDACGSRSAANHAAAMHRLSRAGATLVSTEMVGFEWLRRADHPAFGRWLALVKQADAALADDSGDPDPAP